MIYDPGKSENPTTFLDALLHMKLLRNGPGDILDYRIIY